MTALVNNALNPLLGRLRSSGLLDSDIDYHVVRASMVIMFFFFGYQKWFPYEYERLVPFISNGPLIWWLYPAFGVGGASWFLGVSEWTFGALLLAGFWNKPLGILGALGSTGTFIATATIIPFMPEGWDVRGRWFPGDDGQRPLPDEGCRPARRLALPAEAGSGACRQVNAADTADYRRRRLPVVVLFRPSGRCCKSSTTGKSLRFYGIVSSPSIKNILLYRNSNQAYNSPCPVPTEGRFAIVTIRRARDAMDAVASGVAA